MIKIEKMNPFYSKVNGDNLRMVFAYQYFTISKEGRTYEFIPIEGKEVIVNTKTMQVTNLSEMFVFQRGDRFIRLPLYQLLLVSNAHEYLIPLAEKVIGKNDNTYQNSTEQKEEEFDEEVTALIATIELANIDRLIDLALRDGDKETFLLLATYKDMYKEKNNLAV